MTKQFQSGKFQHFFPGKRISHPIPLPPMELLTLSLDSSFSVCFFSLFFLLFRERRELLPGKPTQNSHFGILAWSCSCAVGGHGLRRGGSIGIWDLGGQGAIPTRRDHPALLSWEKGWIPSQQLVPRALWKPGFFMDVFPCVAPEFFSLLAKPGFVPCSEGWLEQRIPLLLSLENRENNQR